MILYRHWLELRWRWLAMIAVALYMAVGLPGRVANLVTQFLQTGKLIWALQPYNDLLPSMGTETFFIWHEYSQQAFAVMLLASFISFLFDLASAPDVFVLSLPVSRQQTLWMRFLLASLEIGVVSFILLAAAAAMTSQPVPWRALVVSNTWAWIAMLPIVAAMRMAAVVAKSPGIAVGLAAAGFLPYLIIIVRIGHGSLEALRDPWLSSDALGVWAVLGTGFFCGFAAAFAKEREY